MGLADNDETDWLERARATSKHLARWCLPTSNSSNLAWRALGDEHEAQDAAQEAFLRVWQALPNFRGQALFRTWVYRIVTNVCYGRLPRLRRQLAALGEMEVGEVPDESQTDPGAGLKADEQRAFLWKQIKALPESYRVLVLLRYQKGLPDEEIASVLSLPLGTVKTGLFRARARLRAALSALEDVPQ